MSQINNNQEQDNRGGQEYGEDNLNKSSGSQDSRKHQVHPEDEKRKYGEEEDDGFSPGEPEDYDSEDFATD